MSSIALSRALVAGFTVLSLVLMPAFAYADVAVVQPTDLPGDYDSWLPIHTSSKQEAVLTADGDGTYIAKYLDGDAQTFDIPAAFIPDDATVNSVTLKVRAKATWGDASLSLRVEKGLAPEDISDEGPVSLTHSYHTYTRVMTENPFTGLAWTPYEVNNWPVNMGVVKLGFWSGARVTKLSVVVDYTLTTTCETDCTPPEDDDDDTPEDTASLTVIKVVSGGTATSSDFQIHVSKDGSEIADAQYGSPSGVLYDALAAGTYTVSETSTSTSGYDAAFSGDCDTSGLVVLAAGETKTCTITNSTTTSTNTENIGDTETGNGSGNADTQTQSSVPTQSSGGGNGPIAGSFGVSVGGGFVLGTSTEDAACGPLVTHYMKRGGKNDPKDVEKLQTFLNKELGLSILVDGVFGQSTFDGVSAFQLKYYQEVLTPWLKYGFKNDHTPTGYVYKTTLRMINKLNCASLNEPIPQLP